MKFCKNKELQALSNYYRNEVMNETTLELLSKEEFSNLIDIAQYAEYGIWTAIESAFCLGFKAGKHSYRTRNLTIKKIS